MDRRTFLKSSSAALLLAGFSPGWTQASEKKLPILPMIDHAASPSVEIALQLAAGQHDFGSGTFSPTLGINANHLGPVVRVKSGQTLPFAVKNTLPEPVALHWHGLHIPGNVDGGPHQEITTGNVWRPQVPIRQRASTNWFHAHTHGKTARQVYHGLAGVMLIEDEDSVAADLPKTYGVDDFTIVLQDKKFADGGKLHYELTGEVFEDGFEGDTVIINGVMAPVHQRVPTGLVRLRILNACNARFLDLSLTSEEPLNVIASDGGFLASTVETRTLKISPGERYEVLVDMRMAASVGLQVGFPEGEVLEAITQLFSSEPVATALTLVADPTMAAVDSAMPQKLANMDEPAPQSAVRTRTFELNMGEEQDLAALAAAWGNFCGTGGMGINGQPMNMERIDVAVNKGETEMWRITADDMEHPFHVHGCSFRILKERGKEPPAYAQGWKDMVAVQDGASEILVRFDHPATADTPYMYHCHILEHEDCGMMGQFTVG
ncbi:MAG: multicopper oxidase domain-containing protein [Pseudomonadota bacterium]